VTGTPKDLDSIMARFFLGVLKKDGSEYEADSLGSMYNSLDRNLRDILLYWHEAQPKANTLDR
jgi:hypothetical protein